MMASKPGKGPGTCEEVLIAIPTEVEIRRKEWRAAREVAVARAIEFEDKLLASEWCEEDVHRAFDAYKREEARVFVANIKLVEAETDAVRRGLLPPRRVRRSLSPEESERARSPDQGGTQSRSRHRVAEGPSRGSATRSRHRRQGRQTHRSRQKRPRISPSWSRLLNRFVRAKRSSLTLPNRAPNVLRMRSTPFSARNKWGQRASEGSSGLLGTFGRSGQNKCGSGFWGGYRNPNHRPLDTSAQSFA